MKIYKKIMDIVVLIEGISLSLALVLVTALTFGNVVARKVFNHSWGFTDEITVAVFVLISLLAAGVAARNGELVNLGLLPDLAGPKGKKVLKVISTIFCVAYSALMTWQGWKIVLKEGTLSPILHIPVYIFKSFVVIGGISLILHFIENCIDFCSQDLTKKEEE